jgi:membrane protease YdiL (CAAX protease family)
MTGDARSFEWGWLRIVAYLAAIAVVYLVAQVGAVVAVAVLAAILEPRFNATEWAARAEHDGLVVSAATFSAAMLCIPLVRFLVGRHESAPWSFLGVRPVRTRELAVACGVMLVFIAISDTINVWLLDRPLVPPFLRETYTSSRTPVLLLAALVLAAPVSEELIMRGFLFSALRAKGIRTGYVVGITTVFFALLHTQYDLHDMAVVGLIGLLLGGARARYDSILPSIAMHALSNAVAFAETAYVMRS